jgi:hypothetical protein
MKIKYCGRLNSFYRVGLDSEIPFDVVDVSKETFDSLCFDETINGKIIVADKNSNPIAAPINFKQDKSGDWVYDSVLDQRQVDKIKIYVLNDLKDRYLNLKNGAFPVDFTHIVKNLNLPNQTDILFPTTQPVANLSVLPKVKTQNENIVDFSTNKIKYPTHDRCVLWVQDSLDIQSVCSQGHVLATDWVLKTPKSTIFDYIHYQQIGISGIQYNSTQIRTAQPDGYPVVIDKISLKMLMFIYSTINSKKEQLHGRYLLLKTQINNCATMAALESLKENMKTGWVEVFSDTQTPAGLTVVK